MHNHLNKDKPQVESCSRALWHTVVHRSPEKFLLWPIWAGRELGPQLKAKAIRTKQPKRGEPPRPLKELQVNLFFLAKLAIWTSFLAVFRCGSNAQWCYLQEYIIINFELWKSCVTTSRGLDATVIKKMELGIEQICLWNKKYNTYHV